MSYGWITDETLTYMIAVSESTPGPIMVNLATYIGSDQGGLLGAIIATSAVVIPSFTIILLVMIILKSFMKNKYMQALIHGLKPCIIGIILATGVYMIINNAFEISDGIAFEPRAVVLSIILMAVMLVSKKILKRKISPILLIAVSAGCGIIIYG